MTTRRLDITIAPNGSLLAETSYSLNGRDFRVLSRTTFNRFPLELVSRINGRDEFKIFIHAGAW